MTMEDELHYWDFPEGSDQHFWRKEKALYPQWHEDVMRIQQTYWRFYLDQVPEGPSLVTNTYAEDMANWTMPEIDYSTVPSSMNHVRTRVLEGCEEKPGDAKNQDGDSMTKTPDVHHVTTMQSLYSFIECDDDDDDEDNSTFGICMCASF